MNQNELQPKLYNPTIKLNAEVVRSFIEFFDVDIVTNKFRRRVKLPKKYREDEQPLDIADIRNILLIFAYNHNQTEPSIVIHGHLYDIRILVPDVASHSLHMIILTTRVIDLLRTRVLFEPQQLFLQSIVFFDF